MAKASLAGLRAVKSHYGEHGGGDGGRFGSWLARHHAIMVEEERMSIPSPLGGTETALSDFQERDGKKTR